MNPSFLEIPEYVQRMVAATNGRMYQGLVGRLKSYPIPKLPFHSVGPGFFLDIGCGWGRWMVAAAREGYVPVGMDMKWEAVRAASKVMNDCKVRGLAVVADLRHLPFKEEVFSLVWSYSVLQHVHRNSVEECLRDVVRVMKLEGRGILEFPMRRGLWNRWVRRFRHENEDEVESWCVRYYDFQELDEILKPYFESFRSHVHCYFGIGIQPVDYQYVSVFYWPLIFCSLFLTRLSESFPGLIKIADSIYIQVQRPGVKDHDFSPISS
jgi:SAM-dependent methyltransferase